MSIAFSGSNEMTVFFFFSFEFDYVVDYIYGFLYIEASMHPWDEAYLIMVKDCFDVFMDLVGKSFIKYFYIDIPKINCSEFSYVVGFFCGFGISEIVAS